MDAQNIAPRFEFGFGLSYTKFGYSNLQISTSVNGVSISATVQNIGAVDGTEIPQLYLGFPPGAGEPPRVLRGFDDLSLSAGESGTVTFSLDQRDLRLVHLLLKLSPDEV
jgi:beta-glucosidase